MALERAVRVVLAQRTAGGRLVGGCSGRALESALVLRLLRRHGLAPALEARIAGFCRRYLAESTGEVSRAGLLDRRLSRVICELVLNGRLGAEGLLTLERALVEFDHPTLWRKRVLVDVILAELGGLAPASVPLPLAVVRSGASQLWVAILLASIRVLQLCHLGRGHEVGEAEVASIVGAQSLDGSWEQHVLVTCVAMMALAGLGRASPSVARGVEFLAGQLRADGGVPFISNEDVWVTCLAGVVLAEARVPAVELTRFEQYLLPLQQPDGGWGYAEGVSQTDADDTSVTLTLLVRRGGSGRSAVRRAVANLLALQNPDGGFPTFVRGAASDAEITAKAILALQGSGMCPPDVIAAAWSWLGQAQQLGGGFRGEWKLCCTYPSLHVINASIGQRPGTAAGTIRRRCVAFLRARRRADGSWPAHPEDADGHVLSTAYALAALAACPGSLTSRELFESLRVLLAAQDVDGGFRASPDSLGPRPFVYDVPILATIYSLWALVRARDLLSGRGDEVTPEVPRARVSASGSPQVWVTS